MHLLTSSILLALPALSLAASSCSSSSTRCFTRLESTPVKSKWSTKWSTSYTPCTSTKTVTKLSTITSASTSTKTNVITSISTGPTTVMTDTSTVFTTETDTETETETATTVVSTTTSTSSTTTTVSTSAGFVPVQTSLPDSQHTGSGGDAPVSKRSTKNNIAARFSKNKMSLFDRKFKSYPCGVTCNVYRPAKVCKVVQVTTTSCVTATPTVTSTITSTVVITENPSATTTQTVIQTESTTTTATTTTTTSVTATEQVVATASLYAACSTNNFVDLAVGQGITRVSGNWARVGQVSAGSAYDCCVAMLTSGLGASHVFQYIPGTTQCSFGYTPGASDATCGGSLTSRGVATLSGESSPIFVYGNGNCGALTSFLFPLPEE